VSFQRYIARSELRRVPDGEVRWIRTTGADAARSLGSELAGAVDFVFIDWDHSYDGLRADWEGWSPLVAAGGVVALHDSRSSRERQIEDAGSARYTRQVICRNPRFELADEVDTLTVVRRAAIQKELPDCDERPHAR
jgi:predicted O-methyltransferase YrrM